jgi:DNA invertase Pin-like site-specific DNA recombinase
MNVGYIRVSTVQQNEARQREALKPYDISEDFIFMDKLSGKNTDRPKFKEMMKFLRKGDTLYIEDLSRLSRSLTDLVKTIDELEGKGVKLVSLKENIDTSNAFGRMMIKFMGVLNEFERENLLERQREGIECGKQAGKYKGRQPKKIDEDLLNNTLYKLIHGEISKSEAGRILGVTRQTIYNYLSKNDSMQ